MAIGTRFIDGPNGMVYKEYFADNGDTAWIVVHENSSCVYVRPIESGDSWRECFGCCDGSVPTSWAEGPYETEEEANRNCDF